MEFGKTEDIKEDVNNSDSSSAINVSSGFKYMDQITLKCDIPVNKVGLKSVKYYGSVKEEKNSPCDTVMNIKVEIDDGKDELDIQQYGSSYSYEQLECVKIEGSKVEHENEYIEDTTAKCSNSSNKLDFDRGQYVSDAATIKREQNVERENTFQCELCNFKTKVKRCFLVHHTMKHDDTAEVFHCHLCDFKTKYESHIFKHHKLKHDDAAEIFRCEQCDFKTKVKKYLLKHKLKHDAAAEVFHCKLCDYKTKINEHLVLHFRYNHNSSIKWHQCNLCAYKTKRNEMLTKHIAKTHENKTCFQCGVCFYSFTTKDRLISHFKHRHDENPVWYQCQSCGFRTKYKYNLDGHIRRKHQK